MNDDLNKSYSRIWKPFTIIIVLVAVLITTILLWSHYDVNGRLKKLFYKPTISEEYEDIYKFDGYYEDTQNGTKKNMLNWKNKDIYCALKYKKSFNLNNWFDFEIINDNEAYISNVKTDAKYLKIPESVKIDGKKYKISGIKSNAITNKNTSLEIVGNKNITILEDDWLSEGYVTLYMFPNLKNIGGGNYFIKSCSMNNNLESVHMINFLRNPKYYSMYDGNKMYIGDKLKLVVYTAEELDRLYYPETLKGYPDEKVFGGDDIEVSLNNPYYVLENGIMYSSDYKMIYTIAGGWHYDRSVNIDYEIEEILPFALSSEKSFLEEVHFNKNVKKIDKYAFSGHHIRFEFNDIINADEKLFYYTASFLRLDINSVLNAKENSFYLLDGREITINIKN